VWRAGLLLVASLAAAARADDLSDQRDAFGFKKKADQKAPLDCSDGTQFGCTTATNPLDDAASPYTLSTWLPASYLLTLPVGDASHDAVAHYGLGAMRDDYGVSFAGANGRENRWTIEGAPADGVRFYGAETRVPLAFLDGMRVSAGGFTARDRVGTGGAIEARLRRATAKPSLEVHAWAGYSAASRQRPVEALTFFPPRGEASPGPEASVHAGAYGPVGSLWYVAGIGAEISSLDITWRSGTARDRDGDGLFDGLPGVLGVERVDEYSKRPVLWRVPFLLRGGGERGVHSVDVSLVGAAGSDTFYLYNSTLQAAGVDGVSLVGDAIATWRGRWKSTRARAQLAWHRAMRSESAADSRAADIPQLLTAYVPPDLADDPRLSAACDDTATSDPYPLVTNCPVSSGWFASGGAGPLTDTVGDRPSLTLDVAHRVGNNVVRLGATGEDTRLVTTTHFTGGAQVRSLFPGHTAERRFTDPDTVCNGEVGLPCPTVDESVLHYRTRYTAAYVEDTWRPTNAIAVDGGLRWELMWIGPVVHFSDELSPRLGASWDPLGGGRSRVWTSMGRSFAMLPAGLGSTILERERTVDRIVTMAGEGRAVDPGSVVQVAGGVEPVAQDELTAGAQVAVARTVRATVWAQGRWLRRALDTTLSGFDNPGRAGGEPGSRQTGLLAAEVATAPTGKTVNRAGYMDGRTFGTWTGLFTGPEYDATSVNLTGRLPADIGHRTYIEGERLGSVGGLTVAVAVRLTAGSGKPRGVVADSDDGLIQLIPRGSAGRDPLVTQANVRLSARWRELEVTLDVFNAFNRREATSIDEVYAAGAVRPIAGGSPEDLVWLKRDDGLESTRRTTYAHPTAFQSPLSVVLGIHQRF